MKSLRSKRSRRTTRRLRRHRRAEKAKQRGGTLRAPRSSIVEFKQDPYSGGVLMTLEDALEYKTNDPIRF